MKFKNKKGVSNKAAKLSVLNTMKTNRLRNAVKRNLNRKLKASELNTLLEKNPEIMDAARWEFLSLFPEYNISFDYYKTMIAHKYENMNESQLQF